jgi:hypothetical protein
VQPTYQNEDGIWVLKVSAKTDLCAAEKQMTGKYILNGNNYQFITATWSRFFEKG